MQFRLIRGAHRSNWQMSWLGASDRTLYVLVIYDVFGRRPTIRALALGSGATREDEVRTLFDLRVNDDSDGCSLCDGRKDAMTAILLDHMGRSPDLHTGSSKIGDAFG